MPKKHRPERLKYIAGIGVDRMGSIADASHRDLLRLECLEVDIPPDADAVARTQRSAAADEDNSYLPFTGQPQLKEIATRHVSKLSGVDYAGDRNCIITAGGLSGILNVLLATIDIGDQVIMTDPTYVGLINRVRLAGGVPKLAPFRYRRGNTWQLDRAALRAAVGPDTRAMLLMSPSMPSGGFLDADDWAEAVRLCVEHDLLLIVNTAMERLLFDGREVIHPAGLPGMAERTITVGSASKELRMIGWRVGWIVAPEAYMPDLAAVSLANVVVPVGLAQQAAALAIERSYETLPAFAAELERRRDEVMKQLDGLSYGAPAGGFSLLLRAADHGMDGPALSDRLLEQGVAATAMTGWGEEHGVQYVRFVFAKEPVSRLALLGDKVRAALGW